MQRPMKTTLFFSYSQFFVYDRAVDDSVGLLWTDAHVEQGFARRESSVSFGTLAEFGETDLEVYACPFRDMLGYTRAIEVPLFAPTGTIFIDSVDQSDPDQFIQLEPGYYRVVAAQKIIDGMFDECDNPMIIIHVFCQHRAEPLPRSRILIADGDIRSGDILLETAEVAG